MSSDKDANPSRPRPPAALDADIEILKKTVDGLFYPSESDAPFTPFRWPAVAAISAEQEVKKRAGADEVETVAPEKFFAALDATSDAPRFRMLRKTLESTVKDLQIFRAGTVSVQIFLLGKSRDGNWLGVQTESVET